MTLSVLLWKCRQYTLCCTGAINIHFCRNKILLGKHLLILRWSNFIVKTILKFWLCLTQPLLFFFIISSAYCRCDCTTNWHGIHCTQSHDDCSSSSSQALCGHGTCINVARVQPGQVCHHVIHMIFMQRLSNYQRMTWL